VHTAEDRDSDSKTLDQLNEKLRAELRRRKSRGGVPSVGELPATPLVSVIVLNLNGELIIGRCLDHLLAQTYPNLEIIVVDNGSTDRSLEILSGYAAEHDIIVLSSPRNLGIPQGRNFGARAAEGEILAFMDNDAYADKDWLVAALSVLLLQDNIGAVASMVFFEEKPSLLNGAGGGMNLQGDAGDLAYNLPYEFVEPAQDVLFPMGCGMLLKRHVWGMIGALDESTIKWYDDVELGLRVWLRGFRVVLASNAFVDHQPNTSDKLIAKARWKTTFFFERARIRTVLKYYPLKSLISWFLGEIRQNVRLVFSPRYREEIVRELALMWNIFHLPSALLIRSKFSGKAGQFWTLLAQSPGRFVPETPANLLFRPVISSLGTEFIAGDEKLESGLNYGWYGLETKMDKRYRVTDGYASVLFSLPQGARALRINYRGAKDSVAAKAVIRSLGSCLPVIEQPLKNAAEQWQEEIIPAELGPGRYELMLCCDKAILDKRGRRVGLAVSSAIFSPDFSQV
jgi:GT2 family glycosyltransferase